MVWHSVVIGRQVWMTRKLSDHTTEVYEIINKYDEFVYCYNAVTVWLIHFQLFVLESYLYLNCTEYDVAIKHSCLFLYDINRFAIDTTKHSF